MGLRQPHGRDAHSVELKKKNLVRRTRHALARHGRNLRRTRRSAQKASGLNNLDWSMAILSKIEETTNMVVGLKKWPFRACGWRRGTWPGATHAASLYMDLEHHLGELPVLVRLDR